MKNNAGIALPRYKCHKQVSALKISAVLDPPRNAEDESDGSKLLCIEDLGYAPIRVNANYVRKHEPQPGGYYVVYDDGYQSFSPAKAFEEGYTKISPNP